MWTHLDPNKQVLDKCHVCGATKKKQEDQPTPLGWYTIEVMRWYDTDACMGSTHIVMCPRCHHKARLTKQRLANAINYIKNSPIEY